MSNRNVFSIILSFFLFNVQAQDAYHTKLLDSLSKKFALPITAKWALPNTESATLGIASNYGGATANITPANTIFTIAQQRSIVQTANPWDAGHKYSNKTAIQKGDKILIVAWIRSATPNAKVNFFAENSVNYNKEIYATLSPTSNWKMYLIPIETTAAFAIDGLTMGLHLGNVTQTVEIGGVACLNFEKTVIFNQLPLDLDNNKYVGIEADAPWRKEAELSIDQLRKANFTVKVTNASGQPVKDVEVRFEMTQHEFKFGTAVVSNKFNGGTAFNATYEQKILDLDGKGHGFNEVVFENDLKWDGWEQNWFSSKADKALDVAWLKSKNISVRGHNLVWPGWQVSPTDITAAQSPAYIKKRILDRITEVANYAGVGKECIDWDVINEFTTNNDYANRFAGSPGYTTGRELYAEIYKHTKTVMPNAKLYTNDYIAMEAGDGTNLNIPIWKQRIDEILAAGPNIDGIGFQGHFSSAPTGIPRVKEILDEFWNKYKLEAKVTEYDISNLVNPDVQASYMRDILTICYAHPSMKGFLMWGFWDGSHWLNNAPIYNNDWSLKPSGTAFIDQVFNKWWKDEKVITSATGEATVRTFKGKYKVTVKYANGSLVSQNVDLSQDKTLVINALSSATAELGFDFNLKISPNPTTSTPVTITWNDVLSNDLGKVQVWNSVGVLVLDKSVNMSSGNLVLSDFQPANGLYFVTLTSKMGVQTRKLVVH
jgi:endo-1,4-beta-xylanase